MYIHTGSEPSEFPRELLCFFWKKEAVFLLFVENPLVFAFNKDFPSGETA